MNKNLLRDYNEKLVPMNLAIKIFFEGENQEFQVYKIPLDILFYNDQNDRISSWISKYNSENKIQISLVSETSVENYNNIIESFIRESDKDGIKSTTQNIKQFGQQVPAVVLADGRIIDGNRRFTCLRDLHKMEPLKYQYIEAVIIEKDIEKDIKKIKMLELYLQMGTEARVDYDPVDRMVGVYRDLVERKLMTKQERAQITNVSETDIDKQLEEAKLMVEFLEFIKAKEQYHIARELNIDGPLNEIMQILKKIPDTTEKAKMKQTLFTMLLIKPDADMTRYVREVKKITNTEFMNGYLSEQTENAKKVYEDLPKTGTITLDYINEKIRSNDKNKENITNTLEKFTSKKKISDARNKPLEMINKAIDYVRDVEVDHYNHMKEADRENVKQAIKNLSDALEILKKGFHA